jgi:hypothetical protein
MPVRSYTSMSWGHISRAASDTLACSLLLLPTCLLNRSLKPTRGGTDGMYPRKRIAFSTVLQKALSMASYFLRTARPLQWG